MVTIAQLKEHILENQEHLPNWMITHIKNMNFHSVSREEMDELGGKHEQIACAGDNCYLTECFLTYPKALQRLSFYIEYLSMFEYLQGSLCKHLYDMMPLKTQSLTAILTNGPLLVLPVTKKDCWFELPFIAKDALEIQKKHMGNVVHNLSYISSMFRHVIMDEISGVPIGLRIKDNRCLLEFDIQPQNQSLFEKEYLYSLLPRPTWNKARLIAEALVVHNTTSIGRIQVLLDTEKVCVLKIIATNLVPTKDTIRRRNVTLEQVFYYHYETKRFVDKTTSAYRTFKKNNATILDLLQITL